MSNRINEGATSRKMLVIEISSDDESEDNMSDRDIGEATPSRNQDETTSAPSQILRNTSHTSQLASRRAQADLSYVSPHTRFSHISTSKTAMSQSLNKIPQSQMAESASSRELASTCRKEESDDTRACIDLNGITSAARSNLRFISGSVCEGKGGRMGSSPLSALSPAHFSSLFRASGDQHSDRDIVKASDTKSKVPLKRGQDRATSSTLLLPEGSLDRVSSRDTRHHSRVSASRQAKRELPAHINKDLLIEAALPKNRVSAKERYGRTRVEDLNDFVVDLKRNEADILSDRSFEQYSGEDNEDLASDEFNDRAMARRKRNPQPRNRTAIDKEVDNLGIDMRGWDEKDELSSFQYKIPETQEKPIQGQQPSRRYNLRTVERSNSQVDEFDDLDQSFVPSDNPFANPSPLSIHRSEFDNTPRGGGPSHSRTEMTSVDTTMLPSRLIRSTPPNREHAPSYSHSYDPTILYNPNEYDSELDAIRDVPRPSVEKSERAKRAERRKRKRS